MDLDRGEIGGVLTWEASDAIAREHQMVRVYITEPGGLRYIASTLNTFVDIPADTVVGNARVVLS